MALLEVNGIGKSFGATAVLRDISLQLDKGETLAIIGSSGSGKTTLLRCLNFLETADRGQITVDGQTLEEYARDQALESAALYATVENWAEDYACTLTDEDRTAMDREWAARVAQYGGEEAYLDVLSRMGLDRTWLDKQLKQRHISSAKEVFLAVCDRNLKFVLFKK